MHERFIDSHGASRKQQREKLSCGEISLNLFNDLCAYWSVVDQPENFHQPFPYTSKISLTLIQVFSI